MNDIEKSAKIFRIISDVYLAGLRLGLPRSMIEAETRIVLDEVIHGIPRPKIPSFKELEKFEIEFKLERKE